MITLIILYLLIYLSCLLVVTMEREVEYYVVLVSLTLDVMARGEHRVWARDEHCV